jgi:hypothetical protein
LCTMAVEEHLQTNRRHLRDPRCTLPLRHDLMHNHKLSRCSPAQICMAAGICSQCTAGWRATDSASPLLPAATTSVCCPTKKILFFCSGTYSCCHCPTWLFMPTAKCPGPNLHSTGSQSTATAVLLRVTVSITVTSPMLVRLASLVSCAENTVGSAAR